MEQNRDSVLRSKESKAAICSSRPFCQNPRMRYVIIMFAIFSWLGRSRAADARPAFEIASIYRDMRSLALSINADEMPALKGKPVFAVLMETGLPDAAYTLVAVGDGAASLYFSNGGGIIGAGELASVRPEALRLVEMAEGCLKHMKKVEVFPVPAPGGTTFYVVTDGAVLAYTAKEEDLGEGRDQKLSKLFHQGHALITEMRIADQKRQAEPSDGAESR
jgi:hypothetical protein